MSFGAGPFGKSINVAAQVVNGVCPTCNHEGIFVSLTPTFFRCITCGSDIEQKINGKISYIPHIVDKNKFTYAMKVNSDG